MVEAVVQVPGWKSCKEAMPENGKAVEGYHVLSLTHRHTVGFCYWDGKFWIDAITGKMARCQPTHWRPIRGRNDPPEKPPF